MLVLLAIACAMTQSKLSIHTGMGTNSWDVVNSGQPRLIKLLDSFGAAPQIKQAVPGIIIIGRIYLDNQPQSGVYQRVFPLGIFVFSAERHRRRSRGNSPIMVERSQQHDSQ